MVLDFTLSEREATGGCSEEQELAVWQTVKARPDPENLIQEAMR